MDNSKIAIGKQIISQDDLKIHVSYPPRGSRHGPATEHVSRL